MEPPKNSIVAPATSIVAALALVLALFSLVGRPSAERTQDTTIDDSLSSVVERGTLRVGYGGFPPYTQIDPNINDPNERVYGFSVDLIRQIADRAEPSLEIEWVPFTWDTLRAEVDADKFDMIADPVFQTVPRAQGFRLIEPYSYFGIGAAIVPLDETRFVDFEDLNSPEITIALAEGWTTSELARKRLPQANFKSIPVTGDAITQLEEVRLGRVDVALNDVPTVVQYVREHSTEVKALWYDNPPSTVPGGFLVPEDSEALGDFLDESMRVLIADGTLLEIDQQWASYGFIPTIDSVPGSGIE